MDYEQTPSMNPEAGNQQKQCGNCLLCLHTDSGCECCLTDIQVEYEQDGCIDHIAED